MRKVSKQTKCLICNIAGQEKKQCEECRNEMCELCAMTATVGDRTVNFCAECVPAINEQRYKIARENKKKRDEELKANPDVELDGEFYDGHSCSAFATIWGVCQFCGDLVMGSSAYREAYGGE